MSYSIWAENGAAGAWNRYTAETWEEAVKVWREQVGYSGGLGVVLTEDIPVVILDGRPPATSEQEARNPA